MLKIRLSKISPKFKLVIYSDAKNFEQEMRELKVALTRFVGTALKRRGDVYEIVNVPQTKSVEEIHKLNLELQ